MKSIPFVFILLVLITCSLGARSQDQELYQKKFDHYKNMKNTGATIGFIGLPVAVAGFIIYKTGIKKSDAQDDEDILESIVQVPVGLALTVVGSGAFITGIVLSSIGSRRMKEYQEKLSKIDLGAYYAPGHAGITLTYRF